jgi:hypothetical protein
VVLSKSKAKQRTTITPKYLISRRVDTLLTYSKRVVTALARTCVYELETQWLLLPEFQMLLIMNALEKRSLSLDGLVMREHRHQIA